MITIARAMSAFSLPRMELRMLLMHVFPDLTHARIVAYPERELDAASYQIFEALARRRLAGEPLAYLVGMREFYGHTFQVGPAVLIPRPETEHLVEAALVHRTPHSADVLDLGGGSGGCGHPGAGGATMARVL